MEELTVGDQTIRFDRNATVAVYSKIEKSDLEVCGCSGCRNFATQRLSVYPPAFIGLLEQLGIDPSKEWEVVEYGPTTDGGHFYEGWFYLVGDLLVPGEHTVNGLIAPEFSYWFSADEPRDERFSPQLAVEFITTIPWVLPERAEASRGILKPW